MLVSWNTVHTMTMCMLELYCGKVLGEQRLSNPQKLRPSLLNNLNQPMEVFIHWHSFETSFRFPWPLTTATLPSLTESVSRWPGWRAPANGNCPESLEHSFLYIRASMWRHGVLYKGGGGDLCILEIRSGIRKIYNINK